MTRPPSESSRLDEVDPIAVETPEDPAAGGVYIVTERPGRSGGRLILPLLLILGGAALIGWRSSVADWHWGAAPAPALAMPDPAPAPAPEPAQAVAAADGDEAPPAEVAARPVVVDAAPAESDDKPAGPAEAPLLANKIDDLDDIQREAERIRNERAELERLKEEEGEKIAQAPRRPDWPAPAFGFGFRPMAPADFEEMRREMDQQVARMLAQMERQRAAHRQAFGDLQRRGGGAGGFAFGPNPPPPPQHGGNAVLESDFDEVFRQADEMFRQLRAEPRLAPDAFPPPIPGFGNVPRLDPANPPPGARVEQEDILDANGRKIGTRMRWSLQEGGFR